MCVISAVSCSFPAVTHTVFVSTKVSSAAVSPPFSQKCIWTEAGVHSLKFCLIKIYMIGTEFKLCGLHVKVKMYPLFVCDVRQS